MSSSIQIIDDDDDEFDWEAAVQAIDVACQNSTLSTSSNPPPPPPTTSREKKSCRQSTLDGFISNGGGSKAHLDEDRVDCEERVCGVDIDPEAAKTWIYPANVPFRDYQHALAKTALFSNTLVCLPTGLGKTLIAAVVMYNYFRWFPEGKIVFAAPSRPLVRQQIEACHNVVGIPQEWTIDMTGQINPSQRACLWKAKRVFFVTPQVLENDIRSGTCLVKYLVCLVIDEAHRATKNFAYCVAVRELMSIPVQLRILALTATPGSNQQTIQNLIDNLCISTLEYRNEVDDDVEKYVASKKIELMQVPVGQNALDIINLLHDVIRPIVARLRELGVLQSRDYQTASPEHLIASREKFREAPPLTLPYVKHGEVERHFAVLISLYYILKLLSSHGIRPAYEKLVDKLREGLFARVLSRNEILQRMKILMQQSLSHGTPSPKLSKLLEIVVDHFRNNDPQKSRVIIFTHYRTSVRDILDSLANIGNPVKATQFVGQTSGKTLKGQTQKVQQAVLEEFRKGGYNVIVATSIGEEGLDIVEVDLVICFDADVSYLRMVQRMGRTGRKHEGRVVVLACEGKELKGYMRKQGTAKALTKLTRKGGLNSFKFHPSPRMVPHVYKPELLFLELSIELFVYHGRKVKDDPNEASVVIEKLTDDETVTLAKYFHAKENAWEPSLIAFPSFQELPSKVHRVMHSSRTGMLIDTMQYLSGLTYTYGSGTCEIEDQDSKNQPVAVESIQLLDADDSGALNDAEYTLLEKYGLDSPGKVLDSAAVPSCPLPSKKLNLPCKSASSHSFLFGPGIVSLDSSGRVSVAHVPRMLLTEISFSRRRYPVNTALLSLSNQVPSNSGTSLAGFYSNHDRFESTTVGPGCELVTDPATPTTVQAAKAEESNQQKADSDEKIVQTPVAERDPHKRSNCDNTLNGTIQKSLVLPPESPDDTDLDFSPRLTNMIKSGYVPESPLGNPYAGGLRGSPDNEKAQTPLVHAPKSTHESQTPFSHMSNASCSRDWQMSSGEKSETVGAVRKFKRLRKIGEAVQERSDKNGVEITARRCLELGNKFTDAVPGLIKQRQGDKEPFKDVRDLIDEEAEVSSEAEVSADEEDGEDNDSFEDSFVDDRLNPTQASSQPEGGRVDMMAIYRRSLLSQSPAIGPQNSNSTGVVGSELGDSTSHETEIRSLHSKSSDSPHTPVVRHESSDVSVWNNSVSSRCNQRMPSDGIASTSGRIHEAECSIQSRKRKLSNGCISAPVMNLEQKFMIHSAVNSEAILPLDQSTKTADANGDDIFSDDQFFAGLDLDELEAQAAKLLKQKTELSVQEETSSEPAPAKVTVFSSPSFDLGIS